MHMYTLTLSEVYCFALLSAYTYVVVSETSEIEINTVILQ